MKEHETIGYAKGLKLFISTCLRISEKQDWLGRWSEVEGLEWQAKVFAFYLGAKETCSVGLVHPDPF